MAGQGTAAKELFEDAGPLDALIVPLGGGGLLSGCAVTARALNPQCLIVGVEPDAGNDGQRSFRSGAIVHIDVPRTIADGAQTQHLGVHTFAVIRELVDDVITVSDAELVETMRFFASRMKLVVEPTGCLAAAAVLQGRIDVRGRRVGILVSGGNIDPARALRSSCWIRRGEPSRVQSRGAQRLLTKPVAARRSQPDAARRAVAGEDGLSETLRAHRR